MNSFFKKKFSRFVFALKNKKASTIVIILTILLYILFSFSGIFFNGAGSPTQYETRARMYTNYNSKRSQIYSLIIPPSNNPLSYLSYHVKSIEIQPMIKDKCKLFLLNYCDYENDKIPFDFMIGDSRFMLPTVFIGENIPHENYLNIKVFCGDAITNDDDILLPKDVADSMIQKGYYPSYDAILKEKIVSSTDNNQYCVSGIFDGEESFLKHYHVDNYIIGSFKRFGSIPIKPRIGFMTCNQYLENLFFIHRIETYIDTASYGRKTIVSIKGNDFEEGGDLDLTSSIYSFNKKPLNSLSNIILYFSAAGIIALFVLSLVFKLLTKKDVLALNIIFLIILSFWSFIASIVSSHSLTSEIPLVGMTSGFNIFVFFLFLSLGYFILSTSFLKVSNSHFILSDDVFFLIEI